MQWYTNLYLGEKIQGKKEILIEKVEHGSGTPGLYVITPAANPADLLDIFRADALLQPALRERCPMIVGLAKGYQEALDLALSLVQEAYAATGQFQVLPYLQQSINKGEPLAESGSREPLKCKRKRVWLGRSGK